MARRFEMEEDGSAKFWEVSVSGADLTVRFGKLGTDGQTKVKDLGNPAAAAKEMDKLVREKTKKGYAEVGAAPGTPAGSAKSTAVDELTVLRSDEAQGLRDALGELKVLGPDADPEILGGFRMRSLDGDAWTSVLAGIEWLFEEADGGAIGRYRAGPRCVIYLDNEGQFHLSPTLIDHLTWKDYEGDEESSLALLVAKHGLSAPLSKTAREKAVQGIPTPEALVEAAMKKRAAMRAPDSAKQEAADAKPKKAAGKGDKPPVAAKGPRPLCRGISVTSSPDGTLYTLSGEDFGGAYGEPLTKGATFRFEPTSSSFVRLAAQPQGEYGLPLDHWSCWPFAPEACLDADGWRERGLVELTPEVRSDFVCHRLADGSWLLVAGHARTVLRYASGQLTRVGELPELRSRDQIAELGGGRVLLANGERDYRKLLTTLLIDLGAGTITAGPDLPAEHGTFGSDARGRAFLMHGYVGNAEQPATLSVLGGTTWTAHPLPEALGHPTHNITYTPVCALSTGEVLLHSWRLLALATLDLGTRTVTPAGGIRTNMGGARGHELADGRVLFVGGTLYNNIDAEPEIWSPVTRTTSCLPGYDKEMAKQEKELAKHRAKKGY